MDVHQNVLLAKAFPKPRGSAHALAILQGSVCGDFAGPDLRLSQSEPAAKNFCGTCASAINTASVKKLCRMWLEIRGLPGMRLGRDSPTRVAGLRRESWPVLGSPSLAVAIRSSIGLCPANPSSVLCQRIIDKLGGYVFVSGVLDVRTKIARDRTLKFTSSGVMDEPLS